MLKCCCGNGQQTTGSNLQRVEVGIASLALLGFLVVIEDTDFLMEESNKNDTERWDRQSFTKLERPGAI